MFEHLGATDRVDVNLLYASGQVEAVVGAWITPSSFAVLPYSPRIGRTLQASDGEPGAPPVVVLRESLWKRRFGARTEVLGQPLNVAGNEYTIVGVLPDDAGFPAGGELWLPLVESPLGGSAAEPRSGLDLFAILTPTTSRAAAGAEVARLSAHYVAEHHPHQTVQVRVGEYIEPHPQEVLTASLMVTILVLLLVVITANVANLIFARTAARTGELAVRTALGAGRSRLIAQIGAEVAMFGALASVLGLSASQAGLRWLEPQIDEKPFWLDLGLNPRVILFTVGAALIVSVVGGVVPALRATRRDPAPTLRADGQPSNGLRFGRIGTGMLVVEMALTVVLLSGAVIIARGLAAEAAEATIELPTQRVLAAEIRGLRQLDDDGALDEPPVTTRLRAAIEGLPGVESAGFGSSLPRRSTSTVPILLDGGDPSPRPVTRVAAQRVWPGFLETLDARLLAGRLLRDADMASGAAPVVLVNSHFVDQVLDGRPAVGHRLQWLTTTADGDASTSAWHEIVGVVPDLGLNGGGPEHGAGLYLPGVEEPRRASLVVRTAVDTASLAGPLRRAVAALDPEIRVSEIVPLEAVNAQTRQLVTGFAGSLVAMGALVMLLSAMCLYAITSFRVTQRTREIGVRLALGASSIDILRTVVGRAGGWLLAGSVLGVTMVTVAQQARVLDAMFELRLAAAEPWVVPTVVGVLLAAGVVACWWPSRRALTIRPIDALHFD
ncbi:MAG: FtsX-like permease family protein [Acidobacteriota bacterium]